MISTDEQCILCHNNMYCINICDIFLKWLNNPGNNKCLMVEMEKEYLDINSTSSVFKCLP